MKIGFYNHKQLISTVLVFVTSRTKVITVLVFCNTQLYFYYSRNDINSLMKAPVVEYVIIWWVYRILNTLKSLWTWRGTTAKYIVFTRLENKSWIFENAALLTHFLTFSDQKMQSFPVVFDSANCSIRSIIQQLSSTVNSSETIVFLLLGARLTDGKTVRISFSRYSREILTHFENNFIHKTTHEF